MVRYQFKKNQSIVLSQGHPFKWYKNLKYLKIWSSSVPIKIIKTIIWIYLNVPRYNLSIQIGRACLKNHHICNICIGTLTKVEQNYNFEVQIDTREKYGKNRSLVAVTLRLGSRIQSYRE